MSWQSLDGEQIATPRQATCEETIAVDYRHAIDALWRNYAEACGSQRLAAKFVGVHEGNMSRAIERADRRQRDEIDHRSDPHLNVILPRLYFCPTSPCPHGPEGVRKGSMECCGVCHDVGIPGHPSFRVGARDKLKLDRFVPGEDDQWVTEAEAKAREASESANSAKKASADEGIPLPEDGQSGEGAGPTSYRPHEGLSGGLGGRVARRKDKKKATVK